MKSPFPGMDPYLERHWRDIHARLIPYAADQLRPKLPPDLRPRIEERVFVETDADDFREVYPNVRIIEYPMKKGGEGSPAGTTPVGVAEPILVHLQREPSSQGYIEIVDSSSGNRVVTVIEFFESHEQAAG